MGFVQGGDKDSVRMVLLAEDTPLGRGTLGVGQLHLAGGNWGIDLEVGMGCVLGEDMQVAALVDNRVAAVQYCTVDHPRQNH